MSLLISLIALIVAIGALVGCIKKTMHLQAQLDELQEKVIVKAVLDEMPEGFVEMLQCKDGRVYRTTVNTPIISPNVDLRHKGMSQEELDKYVTTPPKIKKPTSEPKN